MASVLGWQKLRPHFPLIGWIKLAPPIHRALLDTLKLLPLILRVLLNTSHSKEKYDVRAFVIVVYYGIKCDERMYVIGRKGLRHQPRQKDHPAYRKSKGSVATESKEDRGKAT